jgi:hypothetical protein
VKIGVRLSAIVLTAAFAAGCASSGNDSRALQQRLVAVGLNSATAKCVVDGMVAKFGENRLGARVEPTREEIAAQKVLVRECKRELSK